MGRGQIIRATRMSMIALSKDDEETIWEECCDKNAFFRNRSQRRILLQHDQMATNQSMA